MHTYTDLSVLADVVFNLRSTDLETHILRVALPVLWYLKGGWYSFCQRIRHWA